MKLSLHTDLALRTLLFLSARKRRATVDEVAQFYGVSAHHLGKVAHQLGRQGWVRNTRGPKGGLDLAPGAQALSVGAVVRAFEGRGIHLLECVDMDGFCVIQPGCRLRRVLIEAERRQMEYLDDVKLSDLLPDDGVLEAFFSPSSV